MVIWKTGEEKATKLNRQKRKKKCLQFLGQHQAYYYLHYRGPRRIRETDIGTQNLLKNS